MNANNNSGPATVANADNQTNNADAKAPTTSNPTQNSSTINTIQITIDVNVEAALIRGEVLPPKVQVGINPAELTVEERRILVKYHPSYSIPHRFEFPTAAAVKAFFAAKVLEDEKLQKEISEKIEDYRAQVEILISTNPPEGEILVGRNGERGQYGHNFFRMRGWNVAEMSKIVPPSLGYNQATQAQLAQVRELSEKVKAHRARFEAENAATAQERMHEIEAFYAAQDNAAEEAKRKVAEKAEQEMIAEQAWRLTNKKYRSEFGSYNDRRCGTPWGARVSLNVFGKLDYDFRAAIYDGDTRGGTVEVPCLPGDIVAVGQRDNRNPKHTEHNILLMREDGSIEELTPGRARKHFMSTMKTAQV